MSNDYYVVSGDSLRDVADTIREKGGTSAQLEFPDGWMDAIDDIETGGGSSVSAGDVWQDANGLVHLASEGSGGDEVPDDGKTRIWIHIADGTPDNRLTFYLRFTASTADNTTVDWGDGTTQTLGSTTATNYEHKYANGGDYIIVMTVNNGTISFDGTAGSNGYGIYGAKNNSFNRSRIKRIILGDKISNIGSCSCQYCFGLSFIIIPNNITKIDTAALSACYNLSSIIIPDSVTYIEASAFSNCTGLTSITIPSNVTGIGAGAFSTCAGMSEYHFKPTTPPTLENSNAFSSIPSDCIIYVPQGSLSAYQSATNWSQYSSKMQEEPT